MIVVMSLNKDVNFILYYLFLNLCLALHLIDLEKSSTGWRACKSNSVVVSRDLGIYNKV